MVGDGQPSLGECATHVVEPESQYFVKAVLVCLVGWRSHDACQKYVHHPRGERPSRGTREGEILAHRRTPVNALGGVVVCAGAQDRTGVGAQIREGCLD